jgi:hypothetical protein
MRKNYDLSVEVFGRTYQPIENNTINHSVYGKTIECRYGIYKGGRKWNLFIQILTQSNTLIPFINEGGSFKELHETGNFQECGYRPVVAYDVDDNDDLTNVDNYIIIDDDSDMLYGQRNHFINVLPSPRNMKGFNEEHYKLGVDMLSKTVIELNY